MAKGPKSNHLPFRHLNGRGVAADELEFGFVAGVFGVHGEVRLHMHNPSSDLLKQPLNLALVAPDGRRYAVICTARPGAGKRIIGQLTGLADREVAASLKGYVLALPKSALPETNDDEFYIHEVVGAVVWAEGIERGHVKAVHQTAEHDVFELETPTGPVFVPVLREFIGALDLANQRVDIVASALLEE